MLAEFNSALETALSGHSGHWLQIALVVALKTAVARLGSALGVGWFGLAAAFLTFLLGKA